MVAAVLAGLWAQILDPVVDAAVVAVLVSLAVAYGLWSNRSLHRGPWRSAWLCLGSGLICVVVGEVVQAFHGGGPPTQVGAPMIMTTGGALVASVGLVSLINQRLPERSAGLLLHG